MYGLKAIKETSVVFPFFMASLAIIRKAWGKNRPDILAQGCTFPHIRPAHLSPPPPRHLQAMRFLFTQEELELLDSLPAEEEDGKALPGFSFLLVDV